MTFEEWCEIEELDHLSDDQDIKYVWDGGFQEGQHAERDRIIVIIKHITNGFGNCDRLIEAINAAPTHGH